jgi:hypothetical protein
MDHGNSSNAREGLLCRVLELVQNSTCSGAFNTRDSRETFWTNGFVVLPSLINSRSRSFLYRYAIAKGKRHLEKEEPNQSKDIVAEYAEPVMEELLYWMAPVADDVCGSLVYPTYSYLRLYRSAEILPRHIDRSSCEMTLSICLGYAGASNWPLWINTQRGSRRVDLNPGDGVFFRGIEQEHWREPFSGTLSAQLLLHYVRRDGPYAERMYDGRPQLSRLSTVNRSSEAMKSGSPTVMY